MTTKKTVKQSRFPKGWDEAKIRAVIEHYENQSEDEAVAEDEAMFGSGAQTMMGVPTDLVSEVRALIARRERTRSSYAGRGRSNRKGKRGGRRGQRGKAA